MDKFIYSQATPVITTAVYASGQAVGGMLTFKKAVERGASRIVSIKITDVSGQSAALDLILFNQSFTPTADHSAIAISAADMLNSSGYISVAASDYKAFGTPSVAYKGSTGPQLLSVANTTGNDLYGQLVSRGTPTYTTTSALMVELVCVPVETHT